jgi:hypothetical protein
MGANIPGKPRGFMVHLNGLAYYDALAHSAANDYEGFVRTPAQAPAAIGAGASTR